METEPIKMHESVELSKMSKGYQWKIKMFPKDEHSIDEDIYEELLKRITKLDGELDTRFGKDEGD